MASVPYHKVRKASEQFSTVCEGPTLKGTLTLTRPTLPAGAKRTKENNTTTNAGVEECRLYSIELLVMPALAAIAHCICSPGTKRVTPLKVYSFSRVYADNTKCVKEIFNVCIFIISKYLL